MASVIQIATFGTVSSTTTATQNFSGAPISGHGVLVGCCLENNFVPGNVTGVADNQSGSPNTYVNIIAQIDGEGGENFRTELWWCPSITYVSGTFTVTATMTASQVTQICLMEIAGWSISVDQTGGQGTTTFPLIATCSSANTNAGDLVVALCGVAYGSSAITNPATTTNTSPSTMTTWALGTGDSGGAQNQASYRIATTIETSNAHWSWTVGESGAGVIATFAPLFIPPPPVPPQGPMPKQIYIMP
jgi:hypothetical protein